MAVVRSKPTSPGRRFVVQVVNPDLHKGAPHRPLVEAQSRNGGRNNAGRITMRHQGGGHKQHYRLVDFKRTKDGIPAKVERLEYDPNRTAHIALLLYRDGERRYMIASRNSDRRATRLVSGENAPIKDRQLAAAAQHPAGLRGALHRDEAGQGRADGSQRRRRRAAGGPRRPVRDAAPAFGRDAQGAGRIAAPPSAKCRNSEHNLRSLGKAGAQRWRGVRPTVRGVVMNPVDHPHGGGEGRTSGGRHPVSPWGTPTKGYKTRTNKRTDKMIVRRRGKK